MSDKITANKIRERVFIVPVAFRGEINKPTIYFNIEIENGGLSYEVLVGEKSLFITSDLDMAVDFYNGYRYE